MQLVYIVGTQTCLHNSKETVLPRIGILRTIPEELISFWAVKIRNEVRVPLN